MSDYYWPMPDVEIPKKVETPQEMRAEIFRLSGYDYLVRNVMNAADYNGFSAEDRYTILAYHALCERAQIKKIALNMSASIPSPGIILASEDDRNSK